MVDWTNLEPSKVGDWISHMMQRETPSAYGVATPEELVGRAQQGLEDLEPLGLEGEVDSLSGGVRLSRPGAEPAELVEDALVVASHFLDENRVWSVAPAGPDELPDFVEDERWSRIDELPVVGPGGRIIVSRLGGEIDADIVCRARTENLGGRWRDAAQIAADVGVMMAGAPSDSVLRAELGYSEPGRYERCGILRPSFVFLLERREDVEGPGWRYAIESPATSIDGDGPDGLGTSTGAGCV